MPLGLAHGKSGGAIRDRVRGRRKKMSVNKLIEEISTQTLAEFDSETRFRTLAASGDVKRGLELLDKLDAAAQGN